MHRPFGLWLSLACLLSAGAAASADAPSPSVSLYLEPALESLENGESQTVELRVDGVPDSGLAAFQVTIAYDPSQLELLDANAAFVPAGIKPFAPLGGSPLCAPIRGQADCPDAPWMLTSTGRSAIGTSSIEQDQGTAIIAYATHGSPSPAIGSGVLATFEVRGKSQGEEIQLEIVGALLADASDPPRPYPWKGR